MKVFLVPIAMHSLRLGLRKHPCRCLAWKSSSLEYCRFLFNPIGQWSHLLGIFQCFDTVVGLAAGRGAWTKLCSLPKAAAQAICSDRLTFRVGAW